MTRVYGRATLKNKESEGIVLAPRNLERNVEMLEGFMDLWKKLHDILELVSKEKKVTDEIEQNFLTIKTRIAHLQARLGDYISSDNHFTDEVMSVLSQIISLKDYLSLSSTQVKRVESQWHNLFILMHGQLGRYETALEKRDSSFSVLNVLKNPWIILTLGVAILLLVYYFLGQRVSKP